MESEVSELRNALYRGDRVTADALVADGVLLNVFDVAALGDADLLGEYLAADASLAQAWSADGFSALHFAAYLGGGDSVRVLLKAGADVAAVARNAMLVQPLHSAVALGDLRACRELLDAGADPNAEQQGGFRPLDEAVITRNDDVATLLRERGAQLSGNPLAQ